MKIDFTQTTISYLLAGHFSAKLNMYYLTMFIKVVLLNKPMMVYKMFKHIYLLNCIHV